MWKDRSKNGEDQNCLEFLELFKLFWKKVLTEEKNDGMIQHVEGNEPETKRENKMTTKNVEKSKKSTWQTEIKVVKYISCQTKKEKCI